jgi:hypothetical protein
MKLDQKGSMLSAKGKYSEEWQPFELGHRVEENVLTE